VGTRARRTVCVLERVIRRSRDAVVKVAWESDEESLHEADALELWDGHASVRLLRRSDRALLEERAVPDDDISGLEATVGRARGRHAKNDSWVTCVLQAKLSAEGDTGSTSNDKGHTLIKVLEDGTIEFKTKIGNGDGETFVAAHIHQGAIGMEGPAVELLFGAPPTSASKIEQSGVATPLGAVTGADLCAT
jgi:hypothetical protein